MNKMPIFVFLVFICIGNLYATGIPDVSHIPDVENQIMLPPELIGEFEFPFPNDLADENNHIDWGMEIHENNKFLFGKANPDSVSQEYGHIIQENGNYYFLPIEGYFIQGKTKIKITKTGFSFVSAFDGIEYVAVKKRKECPSN